MTQTTKTLAGFPFNGRFYVGIQPGVYSTASNVLYTQKVNKKTRTITVRYGDVYVDLLKKELRYYIYELEHSCYRFQTTKGMMKYLKLTE